MTYGLAYQAELLKYALPRQTKQHTKREKSAIHTQITFEQLNIKILKQYIMTVYTLIRCLHPLSSYLLTHPFLPITVPEDLTE